MKRGFVVLAQFFLLFFSASLLSAYEMALDPSAERTQSRNATQGSIKAAYYNPAGLTTLQDGFYFDAGNRVFNLKTTNKDNSGGEAVTDTWTYLLPNAAVAWKFMDKLALFYTFDVRDGGAGGIWNDAKSIDLLVYAFSKGGISSAGTNSIVTKIEGEVYTLTHSLGFSGRIDKMISIAAGARLYQYISNTKVTGNNLQAYSLPKEINCYGDAMAAFFGVMISPVENLFLSLNVVTENRISFKSKSKLDDGSSSEETKDKFMPYMFAFGIGYKPVKELELQLSYTLTLFSKELYYTNKDYSKGYNNEHVIGVGAEYTLDPMIMLSAGVSYLKSPRTKSTNMDPFDPAFDKVVFGIGAVFTPVEKLKIDLALSYPIIFESSGDNGTGLTYKHNRDAFLVGLGVSYGF